MKIEGHRLEKSYFLGGPGIPVLRGLDLVLEPGDFASITGSSGVGKSTFLQVLGTLDAPTAGRVLFNGVDVFKLSAKEIADFRNAQIGFVFQVHQLLPEVTALENVMLPSLVARRSTAESSRRARALLDEVGLTHRMAHRPGELSGGEQQRVALARALVNEPSVLLADEPTGNLDETTGEGIHEILARLNRDRGITVLVVTHNPRLAARMPRKLRMTLAGIADVVEQSPRSTPSAEPTSPLDADDINTVDEALASL
jgi:lipoprotein-releasing system ATP-binding protein